MVSGQWFQTKRSKNWQTIGVSPDVKGQKSA